MRCAKGRRKYPARLLHPPLPSAKKEHAVSVSVSSRCRQPSGLLMVVMPGGSSKLSPSSHKALMKGNSNRSSRQLRASGILSTRVTTFPDSPGGQFCGNARTPTEPPSTQRPLLNSTHPRCQSSVFRSSGYHDGTASGWRS